MKKSHFLLLALFFAIPAHFVHAQDTVSVRSDTSTVIGVTLGGGYSYYPMPFEAPFQIDRERYGFSLRLTLYPSRRLRMSLESGWTAFYTYELRDVETSFGRTDAALSLTAIPVLVVFSMPLLGSFAVHGGTGGYFVRSHSRSFNQTVDVVRFSQGWMAAASWDFGLSRLVRLGVEVKWYGATEFGDSALLMQLAFTFPFLTWK
jgi:hypothetical protein